MVVHGSCMHNAATGLHIYTELHPVGCLQQCNAAKFVHVRCLPLAMSACAILFNAVRHCCCLCVHVYEAAAGRHMCMSCLLADTRARACCLYMYMHVHEPVTFQALGRIHIGCARACCLYMHVHEPVSSSGTW